ncbi:MAG: hypothetical protein QM704_00855 [Anaeromyxobacteraceae bacterium]
MPRSILIADRWLWFAVRAGLAAVLALAALVAPGAGHHALAATAGVLAVASGGLAFTLAAPGPTAEPRFVAFTVEGVAAVASGVAAFTLGTRGPIWLAVVLGGWAALAGAAQVGAGLRLGRQIAREWLLTGAGTCSLVAATYLFLAIPSGAPRLAPAVALWQAALAATFGLLALRLRAWSRRRERPVPWIRSTAHA